MGYLKNIFFSKGIGDINGIAIFIKMFGKNLKNRSHHFITEFPTYSSIYAHQIPSHFWPELYTHCGS
jgi:hypothetical protein